VERECGYILLTRGCVDIGPVEKVGPLVRVADRAAAGGSRRTRRAGRRDVGRGDIPEDGVLDLASAAAGCAGRGTAGACVVARAARVRVVGVALAEPTGIVVIARRRGTQVGRRGCRRRRERTQLMLRREYTIVDAGEEWRQTP